MQIDSKYAGLIYKKYTRTISPDEERKLNKWLNRNPHNREQFVKINEMLSEGEKIELPPLLNKDEIWQSIKNEIMQESEIKLGFAERWQPYFLPKRPRTIIAVACLVVMILLGFGLKNILWNPYYVISTKNGERFTLDLIDGSSIVMNSGTRIRYLKSYPEENRTFYLEGEAFFGVVNFSWPFIVFTKNTQTTVIGTEFNIWAREHTTRISVKKGTVNFKSVSMDTNSVVLADGQMGVARGDAKLEPLLAVDTTRVASWIHETLIFEKTAREEVVNELQLYYNVKITITDFKLKKRTITATIQRLHIDDAIRSICAALDIAYIKKSNKYILMPKGQNQ